jgi:hypothetical protein
MGPLVVRSGGRLARRLLLLTGVLILGVLALGAVEAHAATPASLAGETFTSNNVTGSTLIGACNEHGGGSFRFSVSGTAAGPFPGTFKESGTFMAPQADSLTNFSSTFTITDSSGAVTVTGSKSLVGRSSQMACADDSISTVNDFTVSYTATINGTRMDSGAARVNITGAVGMGAPIFTETFSTGVIHQQCKHGGWKSFGTRFKNQGDCVSFFATRGKNPPSGS